MSFEPCQDGPISRMARTGTRKIPHPNYANAILKKARGDELFRQGDRSARCINIFSGWIALRLVLEDGRCQIVEFGLPGDEVGLALAPDIGREFSAIALTEVRYMSSLNADLVDRFRSDATVGPWACQTLEDQYRKMLNNFVAMVSRSAEERVAFLLHDLAVRVRGTLRTGDRICIPLTQETVCHATGLSFGHVNRVLKRLERRKVLSLRRGMLTILNRHAFEALVRFP